MITWLLHHERPGGQPSPANLHRALLLCVLVATVACNTATSAALDASGLPRLDAASDGYADRGGDTDLADGDHPQPDARDELPPADPSDASDGAIDVGAIDADASAPDAPPRDASADERCVLGRSTLGACTL